MILLFNFVYIQDIYELLRNNELRSNELLRNNFWVCSKMKMEHSVIMKLYQTVAQTANFVIV